MNKKRAQKGSGGQRISRPGLKTWLLVVVWLAVAIGFSHSPNPPEENFWENAFNLPL